MQKVEVVDKRGNIRRCMHAVVGEGVIDKPAFPVRRRPLATSAMPCPVHHEFCPNKHQLVLLPIILNNSSSKTMKLRALGLLLADGAPTVGRGKTF